MRISSILLAVPHIALATSLAFAAPTGPASRHPSGLVTLGGPDAILHSLDGAKRAGSRHPSGLVTLTAETIGAAIVDTTGTSPQLSKPAGPKDAPLMQNVLCAASAVAVADITRSTGSLDLSVVAKHGEHYRTAAIEGANPKITKVDRFTASVDRLIAGNAAAMANVPVHVVMNQYAACALRYDEQTASWAPANWWEAGVK